MKPTLLLDIDGVMNLLPHRVGFRDKDIIEPERAHTRVRIGKTFFVRVAHDAVDLVAQLQEEFEVVWYTMWNYEAPDRFAPAVGLPHFQHYHVDWQMGREILNAQGITGAKALSLWVAKTPLIPGYLGDRPFVWIDDDTKPHDTQYLNDRGLTDFRIITVKPHVGLTQDTVNDALAWARARLSTPLEGTSA